MEIPFHLTLIRGAIGKKFVIKHYGKKVVMTRFPKMAHIIPSKKQKARRELFAEAVAYAKTINGDPEFKRAYQLRLKKGITVYHAAVQEYLQIHKERYEIPGTAIKKDPPPIGQIQPARFPCPIPGLECFIFKPDWRYVNYRATG